MLHALRQSTRRTGRLLLPLLLLSWLSAVCGHCVALAGELDVAPAPHHGMAEESHDCCPPADPCIGGDCEHLADIQASVTSFPSGDHTPAVLAVEAICPPGVTVASVSLPPPAPSPGPPFPIYLRNCVFLI
jgi:hypothetical protein